MSVTAAAVLFKTNFIILPSFSLRYITRKQRFTVKRAAKNS